MKRTAADELKNHSPDSGHEDKQSILNSLTATLKMTDRMADLDRMELKTRNGWDEEVLVYCEQWKKPVMKINVTADSGIAMIVDVLKQLRW